jgi:SAM-dependent methyltransferase
MSQPSSPRSRLARPLTSRPARRLRSTLRSLLAKTPLAAPLRGYRDALYERRLFSALGTLPVGEPATPRALYRACADDYLLWLLANGHRLEPGPRRLIPGLPSEEMQRNWTGNTGEATLREGLSVFRIITGMAERYGGGLRQDTSILDFGCGWGRVIRFFMRDVRHDHLYGVDCYPEVIEAAERLNRWCTFDLVSPFPPTRFPERTFDLVYLYSVFSHLSEDTHLRWLGEFHRILKPGGLLIASTRAREFIFECADLRRQADVPIQLQGSAASFPDTDQALERYDRGLFCHSATGGGGPLEPSFYGESCIPEQFVVRHWKPWFDLLEYRYADDACRQNFICCRRAELDQPETSV